MSIRVQSCRKKMPRRAIPTLEVLEDRRLLAVYTVTTKADDDAVPPAGSLREAINLANANAGQDTIRFNIGNATQEIELKGPLQDITGEVIIDAATRLGGANQIIILQPKDAAPPGTFHGLKFIKNAAVDASMSHVYGLIIRKMGGNGIVLDNVSNCQIGGTGTNQGNTIIENESHGIWMIGEGEAKENKVLGNFIGINSASTAGLGNTLNGIRIDAGSYKNEIGGIAEAARNVISSNKQNGVAIRDSKENKVVGNYIGTSVNGENNRGNEKNGVSVTGASPDNRIGAIASHVKGVIDKPANVISGNSEYGVYLFGAGVAGTWVQGNFIGTTKTGTAALGNTFAGVEVSSASDILIGGMAAGAGNVIFANGIGAVKYHGVGVYDSTDVRVRGNGLGSGNNYADRAVILGNGKFGVSFDATSTKNTVDHCTIRNNGQRGIQGDDKKNKFSMNSIAANTGLGIDIGPEGVTLAGVPVITSAAVVGLTTTVQGTLASTPNSTFSIEFFGNEEADPSGYGEGETFLGSVEVVTDANGNASFSTTLGAVFGSYLTATATDTAIEGGTSEFSAAVAVSGVGSTASVGDFVWYDLNGNGIQDGEHGVEGVTVILTPVGGGSSQTTTTGPDGRSQFIGLAPGDYYLQFIAPEGYAFTTPYETDHTSDSNAEVGTGLTEVFHLIAGEHNPTLDAGLIRTVGSPGGESGEMGPDVETWLAAVAALDQGGSFAAG